MMKDLKFELNGWDLASKLSDLVEKNKKITQQTSENQRIMKIHALRNWCTYLSSLCIVVTEYQQVDDALCSLSRGIEGTLCHMEEGASEA